VRAAFVDTLSEIAANDDRVVLLTGDLGFHVLEPFVQRYPKRFFNMGVAEANMMGVAAGLASRGLIPYCYSIATFASMRGYEQLRDGAALHRLPVRVVGVGAGLGYGSLGVTHHAIEDVAIFRVMAGMGIVAPADSRQVASAVRLIHDQPGPFYLRLAKDAPELDELSPEITWDSIEVIGDGPVAVVTYGALVGSALRAAKMLRATGIYIKVVVVPILSPLSQLALLEAIEKCDLIVTAEDHQRNGGIGSIVAELIAEAALGVRLLRLGYGGLYYPEVGGEKYLHNKIGIDSEGIVSAVVEMFGK
jgi:transketolase